MGYRKIKNGMKGSNGGRGRWEPTEWLKKQSKKARRAQGKKAVRSTDTVDFDKPIFVVNWKNGEFIAKLKPEDGLRVMSNSNRWDTNQTADVRTLHCHDWPCVSQADDYQGPVVFTQVSPPDSNCVWWDDDEYNHT